MGARLFAILGLVLTGAGLALSSASGSYSLLLVGGGLLGLGGGILDMVLSPIVCALQPHRRSAAMNWLHSFYCIGAVDDNLLWRVGGALRNRVLWFLCSRSPWPLASPWG